MVIDQTPEGGGIRLVDIVVHMDAFAEAPLRDQAVEGGYPLVAELDRHQHLGIARQRHEGTASALVDAQLHDGRRP
jgi:hypothetical protein